LQVRRCYLHHRFLLHDHRQTYRWIAPIAFERLLAPTHQPRPPPFATVLRTKALWHLHGYSLAVVCCGGASERRHWHRFCQYSATSRAWGSVIFASPSDSALPRDVDWQVLDARLLNWLRVELHQSQYLLRHTHFDGEPQRAGFSCSKRVVMRPMSARKLIREGFRSRWIHPRRQ